MFRLCTSVQFYQEEVKNGLFSTLEWVREWICSRRGGLGFHFPFDDSKMIDSLSDSTLYAAYSTVSHLLPTGANQNTETAIRPEMFSRKVWDYVFLRGNYPEGCGIPETFLEKLRNEFEFWYPMDLQV